MIGETENVDIDNVTEKTIFKMCGVETNVENESNNNEFFS